MKESISRQILTVAPAYKEYRGGIGAVVNTYSTYFNPFYFIATYPEAKTKFKLGSLPLYISACFRLVYVLGLNKNIRLVHIHVAAKGSFYRKYGIFLIARYFLGRKVIFHSHGSELKDFYRSKSGITKKMFKHYINHVDCLLCLSPQWKSFYQEHFSPRKIVLMENIVERQNINQIQIKDSYVSFLFLGLIGDRKGIFDLIDVIKDHITELKGKVKFYIGGNGETEKLERLITEYDVSEVVEFEGWVDGPRKKELLRKCDVYLLPSYNEGLPISILEAMSYGKPVISSTVGGIPEVVRYGENGFLIEPGDQQSLWESIRYFIEQPEMIDIMGAISVDLVEPYYADNVMRKLETLYKDLLDGD